MSSFLKLPDRIQFLIVVVLIAGFLIYVLLMQAKAF